MQKRYVMGACDGICILACVTNLLNQSDNLISYVNSPSKSSFLNFCGKLAKIFNKKSSDIEVNTIEMISFDVDYF